MFENVLKKIQIFLILCKYVVVRLPLKRHEENCKFTKINKEKFIEYNFVDVLILKKLDEKFQYIDLTKNLAHKGKVLYEEVYFDNILND